MSIFCHFRPDVTKAISYHLQKVLYIGNDLNDMEVMKIVGFPIAPADAHPGIKSLAKLVIKAKGGEGVIRELSDIIIQKRGTNENGD